MDKKATLQELLTAFATKSGLPRRRAEAFVRAFFDVIADALASEKFVRVKGLGTFKLVAVSERESVDVNTGERIQISGHTKVSFTPEAGLRDLINRPFAHFQTVVINEGTDLNALEAVDTPEIEETGNDTPEEPQSPATEPTDNTTAEAETPETDNEAEQPAFVPPSAVDYFAEYPLDDADEEDPSAAVIADDTAKDSETSTTDDSTGYSDTEAAHDAPQAAAAANTHPEGEEGLTEAAALPDEAHSDITDTAPVQAETGRTVPQEGTADKDTSETGTTSVESVDGIQPQDEATKYHETTDAEPRQTATADLPDNSQTVPPVTPAGPSSTKSTLPPQPPTPQPPMPRDVNWWKVTVVVIGILFLMMLSYFAGYFRLFCPCERLDALHRLWTEQTAPPSPTAPATPVPTDTMRHATAPHDTTALPTDTVASSSQAPAATNTTSPSAQPTARPAPQEKQPQADAQSRKKNTQAIPQRRKRTAPRHQKYIITGTRDTYVVSQGETLRTIAEHVYGSRGYARYIIEHNHITHPDDIPVGLTIRLPELELNPDYRP